MAERARHDGIKATGGGGPVPPSALKRIRLLAGWSQRGAATAAGIDRRTLAALEAARSQPRPATAQKLADLFGVEVAVIHAVCGADTIARHTERTPGLTASERLAAFHALPEAQQDAASRDIVARDETRPERKGIADG